MCEIYCKIDWQKNGIRQSNFKNESAFNRFKTNIYGN